MGRLKDLWQELRSVQESSKRTEIQASINKIEQWMIDNKIGDITEPTNWNQSQSYENDFEKRFNNPNYPWNAGVVFMEDIWMVGKLNSAGINYNQDKSVHI